MGKGNAGKGHTDRKLDKCISAQSITSIEQLSRGPNDNTQHSEILYARKC